MRSITRHCCIVGRQMTQWETKAMFITHKHSTALISVNGYGQIYSPSRSRNKGSRDKQPPSAPKTKCAAQRNEEILGMLTLNIKLVPKRHASVCVKDLFPLGKSIFSVLAAPEWVDCYHKNKHTKMKAIAEQTSSEDPTYTTASSTMELRHSDGRERLL